MKRSPVLSAYREAGLIDSFPLHDNELLKRCYTGNKIEPCVFPEFDVPLI
jgi:hypothetical protein